ncbi:MAG: phospholipid carrier-dependent glycosyltransferase [Betaproteobacteria bacterium]|nr:phospholipid carrier-dependent glycosyltransferase [Betaproteobacteria bacterium]
MITWRRLGVILFACLCGTLYFHNLHKPQAPFWDENYYIATTERYLNRMAQLEPHPPLGLMIIAAGEYVFMANGDLQTSHLAKERHVLGEQLPANYSFTGIRFFPALFGALSIGVFLALLFNLSGNAWLSGAFSLMLLFENSFVTHFRAAHLDSIQLFLTLCALLLFTRLYKRDAETSLSAYLGLATLCTAAMLVKVNSVILFAMFPILLRKDRKRLKLFRIKTLIDVYITKAGISASGVFITLFAVFFAHLSLGHHLPDRATPAGEKTWTNASEVYKDYLDQKRALSVNVVAYVIRDYYNFMNRDHRGVPKFDPCKAGENGSHPSSWLLNKKTINYRWDSADGLTRYVQLVGNQVNWALGLLGVILSATIVVSVRVLKTSVTDELVYEFIELLLALYVIFMVVHLYLSDQRVMYLYHYFIGLVISILLAGLSLHYVAQVNRVQPNVMRSWLGLLVAMSLLNFVWLAPLSLHLPLKKEQCQARNFLQQVVECR